MYKKVYIIYKCFYFLVIVFFILNKNIFAFEKEINYIKSLGFLLKNNRKEIFNKEKKHMVTFRRRLTEFEIELLDEYKRNSNAFDFVDNLEKRKQLVRIIYRYAKNHQEITDFTKNIIKILAKILISLTNAEMRSPYYEKFQSADISFEEMAIMFQEYIPQDVDIALVGMEYVVWVHGYLYAYLQKKNLFTKFIGFADTDCIQNRSIDTICYALRELGIFFKLPKKTQKIWDEFIVVLQNGLKDLPQDMKKNVLESFEKIVEDQLLSSFVDILKSNIKMKKNNNIHMQTLCDADEDEDDKEWDSFFELWIKKMNKNERAQEDFSFSWYIILEKLIFLKSA